MDIENLENIKNVNALVFGDFMVDKYIIGDVSRISPEAPIPVINTTKKFYKLGGAGNVVNNIVSLGGKVRLLGTIGKDSHGEILSKEFKKLGVDTTYFKEYKEIITIVKTRVVSRNQQFIRIDDEKKEPILEKYISFIKKNIDKVFKDIDVLIISDYNKGAVTKEFSNYLINSAKENKIPVIVDPKGTDYSKYSGADICTPNVKELKDVTKNEIKTEDDIKNNALDIIKKYKINNIMITRSEKGISLVCKDKTKSDFPALAKEVSDVSGAGDTVVAMSALLLALNYDYSEICRTANVAASIVVSKFGTATVSINELMSSIVSNGEYKLQKLKSLKYIINEQKEKGKKIVFTNGCFDLLHVGHLYSLKEAKKHGDILVVAVNSDQSVKRYKGDLRPIINENDRIALLCALEIVDYVVLMNDDNPVNIIKTIKPDVCIKGEDWKNKKVPEEEIINSYGGRMEYIELYPEYSTTKVIDKIVKSYGQE